MNDEFIGTNDIARMLGVSRAWTVTSITKRPDFPKPVINLSQRIRKWSKNEVLKWVRNTSKS